MENQISNNFKPVVIFLSITLALSSIFYYLIIDSGTLKGGNGLYVPGLMWCQGASALITLKLLKRELRELGWKWGKPEWHARHNKTIYTSLFLTGVIFVLLRYTQVLP